MIKGGGGLPPPYFGWRHMWTAPKRFWFPKSSNLNGGGSTLIQCALVVHLNWMLMVMFLNTLTTCTADTGVKLIVCRHYPDSQQKSPYGQLAGWCWRTILVLMSLLVAENTTSSVEHYAIWLFQYLVYTFVVFSSSLQEWPLSWISWYLDNFKTDTYGVMLTFWSILMKFLVGK